MKQLLSACVVSLVLLLASVTTWAADTGVLTWTANTETDLAGYKVYQSTVSGVYTTPIVTLGKVTTYTVTLPARTSTPQTFYFTITAYDFAGNESVKSLQVSKTIPVLDQPLGPPSTPIGVTVQ